MVSSFDSVSCLTTRELVERIRVDYGVTIDHRTITSWCSRPDNPLTPTGPALRGQTRRFDWAAVRDWVEWELVRGGLSLEYIRGIADLTTRIRMGNRYRRIRNMPPLMEGGRWSEDFHP